MMARDNQKATGTATTRSRAAKAQPLVVHEEASAVQVKTHMHAGHRNGDRQLQVLDRANRVIIEELQRDGRKPYGAIAKTVGLSEAAVRQRVQRLREAGILDIVAVTDPLQLGFRRQAMVGVRVDGDLREVADKLAEIPEVEYVVICAGSFDVLLEVLCEDDDRLLELLNNSIRPVPGVRSTEAFVYLKLAKQSYTWGTR
jgi:Lrp/AsnC family transcriptional regulator, regulator for asnA, asnC and gidA